MKKYIVFFRKKGYLIYISSLDTVQVIIRALRRAKIPFTYTEGFSPHPKLSFSPSLSLGFSSNGEFFEIELKEEWSKERLKENLNQELPSFLRVVRIRDDISNVFSNLYAHSFTILAKKDKKGDLKEKIYSIIGDEKGEIIKINKKGRKVTYLLRDYIHSIDIIENERYLVIDLILYIKEGKSLNPKDIIEHLRNLTCSLYPYRIKRTGFFIKEGKRLVKI